MSPVDPAKFSAFLVAMFFMAISPGPANLFFIRTGLAGRASRVFAGIIGVNTASAVWFIASALGLQVLMTTFPLIFHIVAILGGLYVGWLGLKTVLSARKLENETVDPSITIAAPDQSNWQTLREGFVVQMLNPKAFLFFTAVLPPFVDISRPMPAQMLAFAIASLGMDTLSMSSYGLAAVRLAHLLRDPRNKQRFDLGAGTVLIAIACLIVWHTISDFISPH